MSKVIRLTESDLHNMIKEAINELDWRTYASAGNKDKSNRRFDFQSAAKRSFDKKYNSDLNTRKHSINATHDLHFVNYNIGPDHDIDQNINAYYSPFSNKFSNSTTGDDFDPDTISDLKARQQFKKAAKDLKSFTDGKSHYNPDTHAWENDVD